MSIVILKYGGSSVATTDNLRAVAKQVIRCKAAGEDPVVVISAMGKTTDHFLTMAYQIAPHPTRRELDMLLSVGERISIALMAMAINSEGPYEAVSLTGSQVGIITDTNHTRAKILEVRCARIKEILDRGMIPIVAGFQGVSIEKEITTLGRGGSDTTAVALAAALEANQCRIMKDVDGVYSADPNVVTDAHIIEKLHYDQMLEFSATGTTVLAQDSVSLAKQHGVEVAIGRTDSGAIGTIITSGDFTEEGFQGLSSKRDLIALKLKKSTDLTAALSDFHSEGISITSLHSEGIQPVMLIEEEAKSIEMTDRILERSVWGKRALRYKQLYTRISAIGSGLDPGGKHFARLLSLLEEGHITARWYCCSTTRISFCIPDSAAERTLNRLHHGLIELPSKVQRHD